MERESVIAPEREKEGEREIKGERKSMSGEKNE